MASGVTSHNTNSSGQAAFVLLLGLPFILFLVGPLGHTAGVGPAPTGPVRAVCR